LVNIKSQESANKLIDMIPGILSKIPFLANILDKKEETAEVAETTEATPEPGTEGL